MWDSVIVPRIAAVERCARAGAARRTKQAVNSSEATRTPFPFDVIRIAKSVALIMRDVNAVARRNRRRRC